MEATSNFLSPGCKESSNDFAGSMDSSACSMSTCAAGTDAHRLPCLTALLRGRKTRKRSAQDQLYKRVTNQPTVIDKLSGRQKRGVKRDSVQHKQTEAALQEVHQLLATTQAMEERLRSLGQSVQLTKQEMHSWQLLWHTAMQTNVQLTQHMAAVKGYRMACPGPRSPARPTLCNGGLSGEALVGSPA